MQIVGKSVGNGEALLQEQREGGAAFGGGGN
jgi:hypothetical protein